MTQVSGTTLDLVRQRLHNRSPLRIADDPSAGQAAVAIVLATRPTEGLEVLLIERATRSGDPWSGQVAFPGGRRDPADETLLRTAIRETEEEVGVSLAESMLLGELDDVHPRTPTLPPLVIRPFVFGLRGQPAVRLSSEVASHRWVGLEDLLAAGVYGNEVIPLVGREFPAYRLGDYLVWGLTERIITPFLHLATSEHLPD
ncbi:MAG TPA: CoA pyrophosphatase [Gemmatimonadales bacterium]|nr:CoA pyrophosphatase [Gemmatimonadales bacterium]